MAAVEAMTPSAAKPTRPALRYHGGKWLLAPWIIAHLPPHRVYVEPFGGAASVLLRKGRSYAEVYNDLDGEIVDYFRVLRDPARAARLLELLRLTPFARAEFEAAYEPCADPVERSRRLVVRSFMGFGSDGFNSDIRTGFRANGYRCGTTPAHDWRNLPDALELIARRMIGLVIENRPALQMMATHDFDTTLHDVDPPYLPETRSDKSRRGKIRYHAYRHEMSEADHRALAKALHGLKGMVLLSGYPSALYDDLYGDWRRVERAALADGARPRVEALWLNPAACRALDAKGPGPLFERAG